MNAWRKGYLGTMLAVVLVLGALLGACGTDSPSGNAVTTGSIVTGGTPTVGLASCASCHPTETSDWLTSKHANVEPVGNLYSKGKPTIGQIYTSGVYTDPVTSPAICKNCHDPLGDSRQLVGGITGNTPRPVVGCESCHGGGSLHVAQGGVGPIGLVAYSAGVISGTVSSVQVSAQFATCTSCHELLSPTNPASAATTTSTHDAGGPSPLVVPQGPNANANSITDTHFGTKPSSYGIATIPINGYAMDYSSEKVCSNCHNPHGTADINRDWAQSLHADKRGNGAWGYLNWSAVNRSNCQRCHTTTGYINFNDALRNGDTAKAQDILYGRVTSTAAWNPTTAWKPEMLECNACHTDNRGTIRNPGAFLLTYYWSGGSAPALTIYATADYQFPDVGTSNLCILCHSGRRNGQLIKNLNTGTTPTRNFGSMTLSDSHDFPTGGMMFRSIGYMFDERDYENPSSYRHNQIGTPAVPNTGSSGPCVGCHMYRSGMSPNHLFMPVSRASTTDPDSAIVNVSSQVCFNCHAGSSSTLASFVESEHLLLEQSVAALGAQLKVVSLLSPTGVATTNFLSPGDTDWTGNLTGKNNAGATFNYMSILREPGAFVHNSKYVKRLIYDSIDWTDDGMMNFSVGNTLATSAAHIGQPWQADAILYLLPNGVRPFASSERPY